MPASNLIVCPNCNSSFERTPDMPWNRIYCSERCKRQVKDKSEATRQWRELRCPRCRKRWPVKGTSCDRCRETFALKARMKRRALRVEILTVYGKQCACCGEHREEFLALDHINGRENGEKISNSNFYIWVKQQGFPKDKYRLLCDNCNSSRGRYGYCPHERERKAEQEAAA